MSRSFHFDYVREGQDLQLDNQVGWKVNVGSTTRWFHMPWMAYDPKSGLDQDSLPVTSDTTRQFLGCSSRQRHLPMCPT